MNMKKTMIVAASFHNLPKYVKMLSLKDYMNEGKIVQVIGPVVDIEFSEASYPK